MAEAIYYALAGSIFVIFIVLGLLNPVFSRIKDTEKRKKIGRVVMIAVFLLFLIFGFSIVPIMIDAFVYGLEQINFNIAILDAIKQNSMLIVFVFWIVYALGIIIALPEMITSGFFEPGVEKDRTATEIMDNATRQPGNALPPLEYQIKAAGVVILAKTEIASSSVSYKVLEIWKLARKGASFKIGQSSKVDTKMFQLLGYVPKQDQLVVFLFMNETPPTTLLEMLPVTDGKVLYSPSDLTVQQNLTLANLKQKVSDTELKSNKKLRSEN